MKVGGAKPLCDGPCQAALLSGPFASVSALYLLQSLPPNCHRVCAACGYIFVNARKAM